MAKLHKTTQMKKRRMLKALEKHLGIVTKACKATKISRKCHYLWLEKDPEYKKSVMEVENIALDHVENKLHDLIDELNVAAVLFYLKTKGKKRGFVERVEHKVAEVPEMHFDKEDGDL